MTRLLLLSLCVVSAQPADSDGFRLPPGFRIREIAGNQLVPDIYTLTFDPKGRVVAAGRGYIRVLHDDDGDGKADRAEEFSDSPKDGAMGLLWEGDSVYAVGDGGIRRFRDADSDGKADGPSDLLWPCKTGGEHDAHALRRGPDGWLYFLCGNTAGITSRAATLPSSPVRDPIAGCVVRIRPDFQESEILAHGFRNPFGMDFDPAGQLFTCDSDNERCVSLPWYEPVRFYHVISGRFYGWRTPQIGQFWRYPPYFPDVARPVCTLGRGSPTGVVCYRHTHFPAKYHGGFFVLDWTFGRVYFIKPQPDGASFTAEPEVFLQATGDNGFAPTAAVVDPRNGDLLIAIGGRGTRGAIYRIQYVGPRERSDSANPPQTAVSERPRDLVDVAMRGPPADRLRALQALRQAKGSLPKDELKRVVLANAGHADRYVRQASADLVGDLPSAERSAWLAEAPTVLAKATLLLAPCLDDPQQRYEQAARLLVAPEADTATKLTCLRVMQEALGGLTAPQAAGTVWEGYSPRRPQLVSPRWNWFADFPTGIEEVDREMARTLAMIQPQDPVLLDRLAGQLTDKSAPEDDVHYLIALSRMRGARSVEARQRIVDALLSLDRKLDMRKANRDRNWPLRIAELHARLAEQDAELNPALLEHPEFGRPEHAIFASAPGMDRKRAARLFWNQAKADDEYPMSPALVKLLGELDEPEVLAFLRRLWQQPLLRDSIVPILAREPHIEDRSRFLEALGSSRPETVTAACEALRRLPIGGDGEVAVHVLRCWRSLAGSREFDAVHKHLIRVLRAVAKQDHGGNLTGWMTWFSQAYPELVQRLERTEAISLEQWRQRLGTLNWAKGNASRGKVVYQRLGCAACHSGGQAMGPDLRGVAQRFSRDDLFTAILAPDRDVSPRYQTVILVTLDGRTYRGTIIYEAADGLILQTGPDATVRIAADQIADRRPSPLSLMPAGLLDKATDAEIVDLYEFLKSLR